jgi:hypothetical protein
MRVEGSREKRTAGANNSQLCFVNEQVLPFGRRCLSFFTVCPYLKFPKAFFFSTFG